MDIIFTNSENRLILSLTDKINLKSRGEYVMLPNLNIYYTWKKIKELYKNKCKISASAWNHKFQLPDRSYSMSDIQNCFEYIIKKYETVTDNSQLRIYVNKIENRITFKIKTGYYLERLLPETMKLLGNSEKKINMKMVKMYNIWKLLK